MKRGKCCNAGWATIQENSRDGKCYVGEDKLMIASENKSGRFSRLLKELRSRTEYTDDWWLRGQLENQNPQRERVISQLNELFSIIDDESWSVLKRKLIGKFPNENNDRGKDGFFNTVNEAYAYKYLSEMGFQKIQFLEESNSESKADLRYATNEIWANCEVKTINISDIQIRRYNEGCVVDIVTEYSQLDEKFFGKLDSDIGSAKVQIHGKGLVFIVAWFDDFTNEYMEVYRRQITEWLSRKHKDLSVCVSTVQQGSGVPLVEHNVSTAARD